MKNVLLCLFFFSHSFLWSQLTPYQIISPLLERKVSHADLNSDGFPDIVGKTYDKEQLAWIENEGGAGVFENRRVISNIENIGTYVLADLENDGDIDVVATTEDEKIYYFINSDGLGTFLGPQIVDEELSNPCGMSIEVADVDNDGLKDILFSENCSIGLGWYKNLGTGFSSFNLINDDVEIQEFMFPSDYDMDGDIDIIGERYGSLRYFENLNVGGTFAAPIEIEPDLGIIRSFKIFDINDDGYMDLVYAYTSSNQVAWKENNGDGTFSVSQELITGNEPRDVSAGDIDGDGDMDIISCLYLDNLLVWFENLDGQGNFSSAIEISSGTSAIEYYGLSLEDFDNDGDVDILANSFYDTLVGWLENEDGAGTFSDINVLSASGSNTKIGIADLDNSPGKDLVITNDFGLVYIKNLDGNHNFSTQKVLASRASFRELADINGDGHIDIIARDTIQNPNNPNGVLGYKVIWLQNSGEGEFSSPHVVSYDELAFQAVGDIDQDGDLDIIARTLGFPSTLYLLDNIDGAGNFAEPQFLFSFSSAPDFFYLEDLNGDTYPELIYDGYSPSGVVYHTNLTNNSFAETAQLISSNGADDEIIKAIDFDFDGDIDVAYMDSNDNFVWYANDGQGNFGTENLTVADGWQPGAYAFHDVDSDNDMDLVYHVSGYSHFIWHLQEATGVFGEAVEWEGVSNVNSFHFADLGQDGDIDIITNKGDEPVFFENYINNPVIKGNVYWDENENGQQDESEIGLYQQTVNIDPSSVISFTTPDGSFLFPVDSGDHELSCIPSQGWDFSTDAMVVISVPEGNDTIIQDFGLIVVDSTIQISADLSSAPTRCGFEVPFWLTFENQGATYMNGNIHLEFDSLLSDSEIIFNSVSPAPDSVVGFHAYWSFTELAPTQYDQIEFSLTMPGPDYIGDTILIEGDIVVVNTNQDTLFTDDIDYSSEINCAYDPNDKLVEPSFENYENYTLFSDTLIYTIRFQNTGTDTAFNVELVDLLSSNLDLSTFRILSSSHAHETILESYGKVSFHFNNILLPPQIQNEIESHGFVKFSIQPQEGLSHNTITENTASIFFDFNPPIITNTVSNIIVEEYPIFYDANSPLCHDSDEGSISIEFPPASFNFLWSGSPETNIIDGLEQGDYLLEIYNEYGTLVADSVLILTAPIELTSTQITTTSASLGLADGTATTEALGGTPPYEYNWGSTPVQTSQFASNLASGEYQVTITDANGCTLIQNFIIDNVNSIDDFPENWLFKLYPNPSSGKSFLEFDFPEAANWEIQLVNAIGQELTRYSADIQETNIDVIPIEFLETGIYFIHLNVDGYNFIKKLSVISE